MTDRDLGWSAGIIDGEGAIRVSEVRHGKGGSAWVLHVRAGNTDPGMAERLHALWGGSLIVSRTPSGRPFYVWQLTGGRAHRCLMALWPQLTVKQWHAWAVRKWRATPRGEPLSPEQRAIRERARRDLGLLVRSGEWRLELRMPAVA